MLEMQPLLDVSFGRTHTETQQTYNNPVAKTAETPIFLRVDICKRQTSTIGRSSMVKSETTLMVPPATKTSSFLMQCPGSVGIHSLLLGTHGQISTGKFAR